MAHEHFIISTLNLPDNRIKDIQVLKINGVFHFKITLTKENTPCPFCGGKTSIKEYKLRSYHHLPFAGIPSVIDWNRRRFICKDCGKTFSESNPFGPENFLQSYAVLDSIARALHNLHATYKDIADQFHVSIPLVQLYADSFLIAPPASLFLSILELMKFIPPWRNRVVPIFVFSLIMKNVFSMIFSLIALNELSPDIWIPFLKRNGIVFSSLPSTCGSLIVTSLTAISKTRRSLLIRFMSLNILRWPLPVFVLIL